jgi:hypothetical protein
MKSGMFAVGVFSLVFFGGRLSASVFDLSPAIPERVVRARSVVVVKVLRIEKDTVTIKTPPNLKQEFLVAVVKVESSIKGDKEGSELRVGFHAPPNPKDKQPGGIVGLPAPVKLTRDQEALLFLSPFQDSDLNVVAAHSELLDKKSKTFEKDLKLVEHCMKLLAKPEDGLKAEDAAERFLTARLLIGKYRPNSGFGLGPDKNKEMPIDAEESKLIMKALAEGDWKQKLTPGGGATEVSAFDLFLMLKVTKEDGFTPPKDNTKYAEAAKAWVKENVGKYRVKQIVFEEKEPEKKK